MRVLVACEYSGVVRRAFADRGHDTWSCDLLPAEDGSQQHRQGDALEFLREGGPWDLLIAHPPCTHLSNAGANSRSRKPERVVLDALEFVRELLLTREVERVCVENPPGLIGTMIMPATQYVEPWWFGDPVCKRTGLWLRGLPRLRRRPELEVEPWDHGWWNRGGVRIRGHLRSRTFDGIARQMAEQWG